MLHTIIRRSSRPLNTSALLAFGLCGLNIAYASNGVGVSSDQLCFAEGTPISGPVAVGEFNEGSVYNLQLWYRDPAGGPPGLNFNFSDAVQLTFCP